MRSKISKTACPQPDPVPPEAPKPAWSQPDPVPHEASKTAWSQPDPVSPCSQPDSVYFEASESPVSTHPSDLPLPALDLAVDTTGFSQTIEGIIPLSNESGDHRSLGARSLAQTYSSSQAVHLEVTKRGHPLPHSDATKPFYKPERSSSPERRPRRTNAEKPIQNTDEGIREDIVLAAQQIPGTPGKEQGPSLFDRHVIITESEARSLSPHAIDQACGPNDIGVSSSLPEANDSPPSPKRGLEDRRVKSKYAFFGHVTPGKKPQTVQRSRSDDAPPAPATGTRITESRKQSGSSCPESDPPSTLMLDPAKDGAVMRYLRIDVI
ncbi:MAG: hypothetical protein LQ337_007504 [Flavoplaca oasis]|nr:MAG: hypothetical protein LQ337_007504 [Flavoplaca oasis]